MAKELKTVLNYYLKNSGAIAFERYDGSIAPVALDEPASVTRNITDAEIEIENGIAVWDYGYTSADYLITRLDLWYKKIIPLKDSYAAHKYCQRSDISGEINNFLSDGDEYSGYLQYAYDRINEDRTLTVYADGIRDEATAELLAKNIITWRIKPLIILSLTCTYSVLNIELLDKIGITATILPAFLLGKTWIVTKMNIVPCIGTEPKVNLELLEIGAASLPVPVEWIDTFATGDDKVDTFATGTKIKEIL